MAQATVKKQNANIATVIIYVLLLLGLATYALPVMKMKLPPLGSKTLSVQDVVKVIPKSVGAKEKKKGFSLKVDPDFVDVLTKLLPKNEETGKAKKLSIPFILGVLVPVSLALTYLLILISFLIAPFHGRFISFTSGWAILTSSYTLAGSYYLSAQAKSAFQSAVNKAGEGTFGALTKNFIPEIHLQPESALFALLGVSVLIYFVNMFRNSK